MREILFKAKRKDTGEWIIGSYMPKVEYVQYIDARKWFKFAYIMPNGTEITNESMLKDVFVEVEPSTVCQYTGLTDVNGKRIFEGDILSVLQSDLIGECIHIEDYIIKDITDGRAMIFLEHANELEITGNIYDNHELLKERES